MGSEKGSGRTVRLHPQEAMLKQARTLQKSVGWWWSTGWLAWYKLGVRQARYFGRTKTLFKLLIAAAVANLTLVAGRIGMMGEAIAGPRSPNFCSALISTPRTNDTGIGWKGRLIATAPLRYTGFSSALPEVV